MIFDSLKYPAKPVLIISATKVSNDKEHHTDLHNSYTKMYIQTEDVNVDINMVTSNTDGLSKTYNKFLIEYYAKFYDFIVFTHDDVYIDDLNLACKLYDAHNRLQYDLIGVAGGIDPAIKHPALWHIMSERHNQRGAVAHPCGPDQIYTTVFGPTPSRVVIIDGCFMAVHLPTALQKGWKFNENYEFHHYDISSSIDAHRLGMKVGVYPINIIHSSPGLVGGLNEPVWKASNEKFLKEYGVL